MNTHGRDMQNVRTETRPDATCPQPAPIATCHRRELKRLIKTLSLIAVAATAMAGPQAGQSATSAVTQIRADKTTFGVEVEAVISAVKQKFDSGNTTEAGLAENIRAVNDLIVEYQKDGDQEQLGRLYLLDAHIYADGLKDTAKARAIWTYVERTYQGTQAARVAAWRLARLDAEAAEQLPDFKGRLPLLMLPTMRAGTEVYSNVVITHVTSTNISFTHTGGKGDARSESIAPALRKQLVAALSPSPSPQAGDQAGGIRVLQLYARSFMGQPAPEFVVDNWMTPAPNTIGKFVLIEFWATTCTPCRYDIPRINELAAKYNDKLAVIGISIDKSESAVRKMASPQINYSVAIDPKMQMKEAVGVTGIPHSILVDPKGIVRFEGMPHYLWIEVDANGRSRYTDEGLRRLLARY